MPSIVIANARARAVNELEYMHLLYFLLLWMTFDVRSLVVLRKRVVTLWTLVEHRLPLVRAPQLHRVEIQPLVLTLRTLLVHRRPFARDLLARTHLGPVRVSRLDAVMKLKLLRPTRELPFARSERYDVARASSVSPRVFSSSRARRRAHAHDASTSIIHRPRRRRRIRHRIRRRRRRAPSSSACVFPHPPHVTTSDCVDRRNRAPQRAQNPLPRADIARACADARARCRPGRGRKVDAFEVKISKGKTRLSRVTVAEERDARGDDDADAARAVDGRDAMGAIDVDADAERDGSVRALKVAQSRADVRFGVAARLRGLRRVLSTRGRPASGRGDPARARFQRRDGGR